MDAHCSIALVTGLTIAKNRRRAPIDGPVVTRPLRTAEYWEHFAQQQNSGR